MTDAGTTDINEEIMPEGQKSSKLVSVLLVVLALAYIIVPLDYDGPVIGYIDDSFLFMAALCYFICQFAEFVTPKTKRLLNMVSIIFSVLGIVWLCILAFTPVTHWIA